MTLLISLWSFYGRIGRRAYFFGQFSNIMLGSAYLFALIRLDPALEGLPPETRDVYFAIFVGLGLFFFFWLHLALSAKRFHDLGNSGWFVLLLPVPIIGFLWFLYLLFGRGQDGDNDYGPARRVS